MVRTTLRADLKASAPPSAPLPPFDARSDPVTRREPGGSEGESDRRGGSEQSLPPRSVRLASRAVQATLRPIPSFDGTDPYQFLDLRSDEITR